MDDEQGWMPVVVYTVPAGGDMSACFPPAGAGLRGSRQGGLTIFLGQHEGVPGGLEAGPGHDEFCAADLAGTVYHAAQVIVVSLFAIVDAAEYGIGKVDSDLTPVSSPVGIGTTISDPDLRSGLGGRDSKRRTSMYLGA